MADGTYIINPPVARRADGTADIPVTLVGTASQSLSTTRAKYNALVSGRNVVAHRLPNYRFPVLYDLNGGDPVIVDLTDVHRGEFFIGYPLGDPVPLTGSGGVETTLRLQLLPPWNTTIVNTGKAELWDLNPLNQYSVLDPTEGYCEFQVDWTAKKVSSELILVHKHSLDAWLYLEWMRPDNSADPEARAYSWDGANYQLFADWTGAGSYTSGNLYYLDGQTATTKWGLGLGCRLYQEGDRGAAANPIAGDAAAGAMTYSSHFGTLKRMGIAIKLKPDTGSEDLSGANASNKTRIKIETFFADPNGKTTY